MEFDYDYDDDPLADAFEDDDEFRKLLKNRTFTDYLNTFLSLPVFAVRVLYRRDRGKFELEEPITRNFHHLDDDNITRWVRVNRGEMFLKTSICNEYRFCATLLDLPVCLRLPGYNEDELQKFQSKYLTKVIDMQRLKGYMQGSIGESLISFWLDAERFRRQVSRNCRRFVLKEMYSKYLMDGAVHELSHSVREDIKMYLRSIDRDDQGARTILSSDVLSEAQDLVLETLQDYWIPKYVQHRLNRRGLIKNRWARAMALPQKINAIRKKQAKLTEIVEQLKKKKKKDENEAKKDKEENDDDSIPNPINRMLRRRDGIRRHSTSLDTRPSKRNDQWRKTSMANEVKLDSDKEPETRKRSRTLSLGATEEEEKTEENPYVPLYLRLLKKKDTEDEVEIIDDENGLTKLTQSSKSKMVTIETPAISEMGAIMEHNNNRQPAMGMKKRRVIETLVEDEEAEYEADTEDVPKEVSDEIVRLPKLINTLEKTNRSFTSTLIKLPRLPSKVQFPYSKSFVKENELSVVPDEDKMFSCLVGALTTDQVAGQPLLEYFKEHNKKEAESNLKFWTASNDILSDCRSHDPIMRQKQYHTLIHLHLSDLSGSLVSLPRSVKEELCALLPRDVGVTKLMEATNDVAQRLMSEWDEFVKHDKRTFLRQTTKSKRKVTITPATTELPVLPDPQRESKMDPAEFDDDFEFDGTLPDTYEMIEQRVVDARALNSRRMWRAMELAISICKPKHIELLVDANENEKWTTDESDDNDSDDENDDREKRRDERAAGSLALNSLEYLNKKHERLKKLEDLFNKRHRQSLTHDYLGVDLFRGMDQIGLEQSTSINNSYLEDNKKELDREDNKPPRPRCFQDCLSDPTQFEHFKRYLAKEKEETPLLFWSAVESMRTTSKSAKARQGRTHGIVKRYFGPAALFGKDLKCNADIIKEIPYMEKVSPAMLVSAQACVSKTLEETWFSKYLLTFGDAGGAIGVTLLPSYQTGNEVTRSVKSKTRGLWRMFTKNVISFRRGIMGEETLQGFTEFLQLQHNLNMDQATKNNQVENGIPPRIVVSSKLVHTEKLIADLNFWSEVSRYKEFADAVVLCAKLGNYTKDDELIVVKKAKTIVECFLDSQIPPRVQVNISNDLADNVIQLVQNGIIERGLFHEAALSTFSTLIFFWKKFCLHRFLPVEKKPVAKERLHVNRSEQIISKQKLLKSTKAKKVSLSVDEDCTKLMFSLQLGLRLGLPKSLMVKRRGSDSKESGILLSPTRGRVSHVSPRGRMSHMNNDEFHLPSLCE